MRWRLRTFHCTSNPVFNLLSLASPSCVGEPSGWTSGGGHTGHHPGPEPGSVLLWVGGQCGGGGCALRPTGGGIHNCRTVRETPPLPCSTKTHMDSYCTVHRHTVQMQTHTYKEKNTCNLFSSLTLFFSLTLAQSVNKPEPSDASSGWRIVWGALHCSGAVRAKGRDSLCVVVVMRLSAQL